MEGLKSKYKEICELASRKQDRLEDSRRMHRLFANIADELAWLKEKQQLLMTDELTHDLASIQSLISKHKV